MAALARPAEADDPPAPAAAATVSAACALEPGPTRAVTSVLDGETIVLDDGSHVRLVGALAPAPPLSAPAPERWRPQAQATAALTDLLAGGSVELGFAGVRTDRYGRLLAQVHLVREGERVWVQEHMIRLGHARAYALPGSGPACATRLVEAERHARAQRAGLWSSAAYAIRDAERTSELMRLRSTFQLVEGRIVEVGRSRGRIYLNFGADWREDFTVGVSAELARANDEWAAGLDSLRGARVRARGFVERRNGPFIALDDPAFLEVLEPAGSGGDAEGR